MITNKELKNVLRWAASTHKDFFVSDMVVVDRTTYYAKYCEDRIYAVYKPGMDFVSIAMANNPREAVEKVREHLK